MRNQKIKQSVMLGAGFISGVAFIISCNMEQSDGTISGAIGAALAKASEIAYDTLNTSGLGNTVQQAIETLFGRLKDTQADVVTLSGRVDDHDAELSAHQTAINALQGGAGLACPTGMIQAAPGVCMDVTPAQSGTAKTYTNAESDCRSFGKTLCPSGLIYSACAAGQLQGWQANGWEWSQEIYQHSYYIDTPWPQNVTTHGATLMLYNSTTSYGCGKFNYGVISGGTGATAQFRCCLNR